MASYTVVIDSVTLDYDFSSGYWKEETAVAEGDAWEYGSLEDALTKIEEIRARWERGEDYAVKRAHGPRQPPRFEYRQAYIQTEEEPYYIEDDAAWVCSLPADVDPRNG